MTAEKANSQKKLAVSLGQFSDAGIKSENEDFFGAYIPDDSQLEYKGLAVAIADGMSGSDGAKEASQMSVRMFLDDYYSAPESWTVKKAVTKVMTAMNRWLYSQGQDRYEAAKGLVTTFSAVILKSQTLHVFHIGDTRIYRYRNGDFEQLTQDHRVWISDDREYLSRALGIDINLNIDYRKLPLEVGDIYFMSSDGVHDFISESKLQEMIVAGIDNLQQTTEQIVKAAISNKSDDNLTCQLLRIESLGEQDKDEFYDKLTRLPFPPELEPGNIIDGYRIVRELNATSRSQVYLAEDTLAVESKKIVLKTPSINFEDDATYIDLFLQEEWIGKRLKSPHLIKTHGVKRKRTFLYTIVEYIEGQTLKQWMADNPEPGLTQLRGTISQIARGLRTMHRLEMIHQDLKPDNILIDKNNTLKIIDFGSTKIAGLAELQSVVEHDHILGTANYSAPEYFRGEPGTNRADIYSLGVIAYEMLTGKLPYGEITPQSAKRKKFKYRSARRYNPIVPKWIDAALKKACQPRPEFRYSLLSEFITDLTKPNEHLLKLSQEVPLIERNPLRFWQAMALLEAIIIIILLIVFYQ